MPSVCNTWAGSYVDKVHRYDIFSSNKTPFHLTEGKQNTKLAKYHIPYTVPSASIFTVQRVCEHRQITFTDGASSTIGTDRWITQCDKHLSRNVAMLRVVLSCYKRCEILKYVLISALTVVDIVVLIFYAVAVLPRLSWKNGCTSS